MDDQKDSNGKRLNFPFFMYPNTPMCGYHDPLYLNELIRLKSFFDLSHDNTKYVHVTIGAPFEEIEKHDMKGLEFQSRQLFPYHLEKIASKGTHVTHIIICPNDNFHPDFDHSELHFMNSTENKFIKVDNMHYKTENLPIDTFIFYTMLPTRDKIRNDGYQKKFKDSNMKRFCVDIEKYFQTDYDRDFVGVFYNSFDTFIKKVLSHGGLVSCFSFAVFNESTINAKYKMYEMFKELIPLFSREGTILNEWSFRLGCFAVYPVNNSYYNKLITYADPYQLRKFTSNLHDIHIIDIRKIGDSMKFAFVRC